MPSYFDLKKINKKKSDIVPNSSIKSDKWKWYSYALISLPNVCNVTQSQKKFDWYSWVNILQVALLILLFLKFYVQDKSQKMSNGPLVVAYMWCNVCLWCVCVSLSVVMCVCENVSYSHFYFSNFWINMKTYVFMWIVFSIKNTPLYWSSLFIKFRLILPLIFIVQVELIMNLFFTLWMFSLFLE